MSKEKGRLVLGFKLDESFYVQDLKYTVVDIKSPRRFKILKHGSIDEILEIASTHAVEIFPEVFASAGPSLNSHDIRIVLEAPRSIRLDREKIYLKKQKGLEV